MVLDSDVGCLLNRAVIKDHLYRSMVEPNPVNPVEGLHENPR
jgi:hypothetical protein